MYKEGSIDIGGTLSSSSELSDVSGDDILLESSISWLRDMSDWKLSSLATHSRLRVSAPVLGNLIPEVKRDDPLWDSITATVDEDLIDVQLRRHNDRRGRRVRVRDLDDAVVPLMRLGDLDGCRMSSWNATLG